MDQNNTATNMGRLLALGFSSWVQIEGRLIDGLSPADVLAQIRDYVRPRVCLDRSISTHHPDRITLYGPRLDSSDIIVAVVGASGYSSFGAVYSYTEREFQQVAAEHYARIVATKKSAAGDQS